MLGWVTAIGLSLAGVTHAAGCQRWVWLARLLGGPFAAAGLCLALAEVISLGRQDSPPVEANVLPVMLMNKPWSVPGGVLLLEVRPETSLLLCGVLLLVLLATQLFPGRFGVTARAARWDWWGSCVLAGLVVVSGGLLLRLYAWVGLLLLILASDPAWPVATRKRGCIVLTLALILIVGGAVVLSGTGDVLAWERSAVGSEWGQSSLLAGIGLVILELLDRSWTTHGWQRQAHVWRLWLWFVVSAAALEPLVLTGDKNVWSSLPALGLGAFGALAAWCLAHRFSVTKEPT